MCRSRHSSPDLNETWRVRSASREVLYMAKHPGFAKVAAGIAKKQGISSDAASAILASSTRNASAAAKKNPRLKNVPKAKKK